jgi:hypothetical protein
VPFGTKALYEQADVWKNFGTIVEIRPTHTQPKFSPIVTTEAGYIYNIGTRQMITMGEAYGTQSVVGPKGRLYQWMKNASMGDGVFALIDINTGKVIFRTSTDTRVGEGVKACFGDGIHSSKSSVAYWTPTLVGENIYTLAAAGADYVENEYLGTDANHRSDEASPTHGIYWDVQGVKENTMWAFVTENDYKNAQAIDEVVAKLKTSLAVAKEQNVDASDEQAVYDNPQSTLGELMDALSSVRAKLHFITFADSKVQKICLENWDTNGDGELTFEEAQAVTDIAEIFLVRTSVCLRSSSTSPLSPRFLTTPSEMPAICRSSICPQV